MNVKYIIFKHKFILTLVTLPLLSIFINRTFVNAESPLWSITTHFGDIDASHPTPHKGLDFSVPVGTELNSIVDGRVEDIRYDRSKSWGTSVHIRDSQDRVVIYGHMDKVNVFIGESVAKGDLVGYSGNTGRSTGAHFHLEIRINGKPINPMKDIIGTGLGKW